jgi:hypothetical protein
MQIHELTSKKNLDEGVLDTVKSVAGRVGQGLKQGASRTAYDWGIGQGVKGTSTDLTNKIMPLWNQTIAAVQQRTPNQPVNDRVYETELENFISKVFYKNRLHIENDVVQKHVADTVRRITRVKDNPGQIATEFNNLVNSLASMRLQSTAAQQADIPVGQRISVPYVQQGQSIPAYYYKNAQGWTNANGEAVTSPSAIEHLDSLIATSGRRESDPNVQATPNYRKMEKKRPR